MLRLCGWVGMCVGMGGWVGHVEVVPRHDSRDGQAVLEAHVQEYQVICVPRTCGKRAKGVRWWVVWVGGQVSAVSVWVGGWVGGWVCTWVWVGGWVGGPCRGCLPPRRRGWAGRAGSTRTGVSGSLCAKHSMRKKEGRNGMRWGLSVGEFIISDRRKSPPTESVHTDAWYRHE